MSVNIHEAKTQFSRLIEKVESGDEVVIARAGRPVARITRLDAPAKPKRLGFLVGGGSVPDDFNEWGSDQIVGLFEGDS